jgi:hypothetical protein
VASAGCKDQKDLQDSSPWIAYVIGDVKRGCGGLAPSFSGGLMEQIFKPQPNPQKMMALTYCLTQIVSSFAPSLIASLRFFQPTAIDSWLQ